MGLWGTHDEYAWQRNALAAPDGRFLNIAFAFAAMGSHVYFRLHKEDGLVYTRRKGLVFAGVSQQNVWNWTIEAQLRRPLQAGGFQQPTTLNVSAAMVIPIEMAAFFAGRRKHGLRL